MQERSSAVNALRLYWSRGTNKGERRNFGDWLSPMLCEALSSRKVEWSGLESADLVAVGSLLDRLKSGPFRRHRVDVWGSGFLFAPRARRTRHIVHAVRDHHSAQALRSQQVLACGDPVLLCEQIAPPMRVAKTLALGVMPHYRDQDLPELRRLVDGARNATWIDVFDDPRDVLRQIASCEVVLSSSLHGLVAADALGVPNAWIRPSDRLDGDDYKFRDYYSVFGIGEPQPLPLPSVESLRGALDEIRNGYRCDGLDRIKRESAAAFPYAR